MFGMQSDTDLKIILGVMVFLLAVMIIILFWHFLRMKLKKGPEGTMSLTDLKNLESKNLLTKEELNALRHAMARQYLHVQETEQAKTDETKGLKPLEALALEAQKAEVEAAKKAAGGDVDAKSAVLPALVEKPPPASVPAGAPPDAALPEHLKPLLAKPPQEIEDMLNAGFLSQEDYDLVVNHRQKSACPRCIG